MVELWGPTCLSGRRCHRGRSERRAPRPAAPNAKGPEHTPGRCDAPAVAAEIIDRRSKGEGRPRQGRTESCGPCWGRACQDGGYVGQDPLSVECSKGSPANSLAARAERSPGG